MESLEERRVLTTYAVDTIVDESDGDFSAGDFSLREPLEQAAADPAHDIITPDPSLSGRTIALELQDIDLDGRDPGDKAC